jgi:hypothetical protein
MSIAQPDGVANNPGVNRVSFLSVLYLLLASYAFGPIAAHSLEMFLGLLLTAFITFLFVRAVTKSALAGFIAGLIYGFWPLMLGIGRAASTYTHMWLYLLPIWAFWELARESTPRRAILAAASIVPAIFWTPYFAFHIFLIGLSGLLVASWYIARQLGMKKTLLMAGSIGAAWIAIYAAYYAIGITGSPDAVPVRSSADFYDQSAHPLMYILPGESSSWDHIAYTLLVRLVPRADHSSLYVGLSVVALALFGIFQTLKQRGKALPTAKPNPTYVAVVLGVVVATCCFVFSLQPSIPIAGLRIPTPNYFVTKAVPALRAGQRLAMPLMGALALLAGIGAYHLLNRFSGWRKYVALAALICVLAVDLWAPYPQASSTLIYSPAILQLRDLPDGRVAQYEENSLVGYAGEIVCLEQLGHGKPVINDCGVARPTTDLNLPPPHLAKLISLPLCEQLPALKTLDVRYLIVPNDNYEVLQCVTAAGQILTPILQDSTYQIFRVD